MGVLLFAFLGTATLYSIAVPIWEAPDEPEHFQYVYFLLEQHGLPHVLPTITPDGNEEGKQPPLYYLLALPFAAGIDLSDANRIRLSPHVGWPHDPAIAAHLLNEAFPYHGAVLAAHRIRLLSTLLGTATVALTYGIAATCLRSRRLGLMAAAFAAVLPGFLFASATIDNDMLVNTLSAAMLFIVVGTDRSRIRWFAVAFGVLGCLALLAKLNAIIPVVIGIVWLAARARREERRGVLLATIAPLLPAVLYWCWHVLSGQKTLISKSVGWPPPLPGSAGPLQWSEGFHFLTILWSTFFGAFGWPNVWLPPWAYGLYGLVYGGGMLVALLSLRHDTGPSAQQGDLTVLLTWFGAILAAMLVQPFLVRGSFLAYGHSRYLYPALAPIATLVTYGWTRAAARRPLLRHLLLPTLTLAAAALAAAALAIPWLIIRPAYLPPYPVGDRVPAAATPVTHGDFVDSVTLAGVELPIGPVGAGQGTRLTFYWRVQHPLPDGTWLFVHVVNDLGQTAAAFDGAPLYNTFPLSYWRHGDVVIDRELLTFHADAAAGLYQVKVGWYNPKTGARVPLASAGNELSAGTVLIAPAAAH